MFNPTMVRGLVSVDETHVVETRPSGATIQRYFIVSGDRYRFDFEACTNQDGWTQYDTDQDASYFGIWVHIQDREVVTYAEGDVSVVRCESEEQFQAELKTMKEFYGAPPPAFKTIDENGALTHHYDEETAKMLGRELPQ